MGIGCLAKSELIAVINAVSVSSLNGPVFPHGDCICLRSFVSDISHPTTQQCRTDLIIVSDGFDAAASKSVGSSVSSVILAQAMLRMKLMR